MCAVLGVSRSGYYDWASRPESGRMVADRALADEIRATHEASRGRYGSPRVHAELRAQGRQVGRKRVARLMRGMGLSARRKRRFRRTTDSTHAHPVAPNLLARNFMATAPDRVWLADLTYIWTREGWLYLAVVLDLFSRRVVGWAELPKVPPAQRVEYQRRDGCGSAASGRRCAGCCGRCASTVCWPPAGWADRADRATTTAGSFRMTPTRFGAPT